MFELSFFVVVECKFFTSVYFYYSLLLTQHPVKHLTEPRFINILIIFSARIFLMVNELL